MVFILHMISSREENPIPLVLYGFKPSDTPLIKESSLAGIILSLDTMAISSGAIVTGAFCFSVPFGKF